MTRRISFCLFGQASSICNVKPCRRAFHLQLVMQDLYHNVKGHKKNEIWAPYLWGKKWVYEKRSNMHICQKQIIYVNTGWRQLAREYYIKLIMGRWPCISEILIILAVHVNDKTRICAECSATLPAPLCSDPQPDTSTQDEKTQTTWIEMQLLLVSSILICLSYQ